MSVVADALAEDALTGCGARVHPLEVSEPGEQDLHADVGEPNPQPLIDRVSASSSLDPLDRADAPLGTLAMTDLFAGSVGRRGRGMGSGFGHAENSRWSRHGLDADRLNADWVGMGSVRGDGGDPRNRIRACAEGSQRIREAVHAGSDRSPGTL